MDTQIVGGFVPEGVLKDLFWDLFKTLLNSILPPPLLFSLSILGISLLQYFLASRKTPWLGWILPAAVLFYSFVGLASGEPAWLFVLKIFLAFFLAYVQILLQEANGR